MDRVVHRKLSRRAVRSLVLFGVTVAVVSIVLHSSLSRRANIEERARTLSSAQGIVVGFGNPGEFALPSYSNGDIFPAGLRAVAADREHVAAALDGLELALASYPSGFASKLIRAVFICGVLHAGDARASGTIGANWILIAAPADRSLDDVREMVVATYHHELSSAVLRQPGAMARWVQYWPSGRTELHEYNDVSAHANDREPDPATGFLSAYAMTNPENDFNVYAELVFIRPETVRALSNRYEIVRSKAALLVELYSRVEPRMESALRRRIESSVR